MSKCADPVLCYTGQKRKQYRHWSLATPFFRSIAQQVFNCGTCIFCRKRRATELAMRCVLHASLYKENCFLTLTYDEKRPDYHNNFQYSDIQNFKKRLRRWCEYHQQKKIQIFNVHEYGRNHKKHWHLVVFNHDFKDKELFTVKNGNRLYTSEKLTKRWPFGFSTIGNVTEASAMYQAQYTQKDLQYGHSKSARASHSKHSGIGRDYFLTHYDQILRLGYVPFSGRRVPIPRYFTKLAHKHYCWFHERSAFFDNPFRKKLYSASASFVPNNKISDLYIQYALGRAEFKAQLEQDWDEFLASNITNKKPDFALAASNYLYDLNKNKQSDF